MPADGNCYSAPSLWTDPEDRRDARAAIELCNSCPLLEPCRDFAAKFRWFFPTVIAGWQPPEPTREKLKASGSIPPWAPKDWKPLRPLTGMQR